MTASKFDARRLDRVQAENVIHDVEFRMVPVLQAGSWVKPEKPLIVIAPTFPESVEGENVLSNWIEHIGIWAQESKVEVLVHLHPSSKKSLREKVDNFRGVTRAPGPVKSMQLREISLVITDFSSIAHDALLVGTPVMMVVGDIEKYKETREIFIDQEQWDCSYIASDFEKITQLIEIVLSEDNLEAKRITYSKQAQSVLNDKPGANTVNSILDLVRAKTPE
jgi:CDP-glycerol glycerophosphotransferase (TagB/SpsB family)